MLVTMKAVLDHANSHTYGVMAVNSINMEMVRATIEAATEQRSPVIIQMGPGQIGKHAHMSEIVPLVTNLARKAPVPVALNLDHGSKLEDITAALEAGFTNVMIDASSLPFEENVQKTSTVVGLAHAMGVSVEAELGHVGQAVDGDGVTDDFYTNVAQATEFVDRTGCDALAVAIGTAHGNYPKGYVPKLDFDRLAQLKEALGIPLVLHGGSGAGDENLRRAVAGGINKINVCTDAFATAKQAMLTLLKNDPSADFLALQMEAEAAVKRFVMDYMEVIGSAHVYEYASFESGSKE